MCWALNNLSKSKKKRKMSIYGHTMVNYGLLSIELSGKLVMYCASVNLGNQIISSPIQNG